MARVLVATPEPIARRHAGPAIRAAHIARVLAQEHEVTLASTAGEGTSPVDGRPVWALSSLTVDDFDAAIVQGGVLLGEPSIGEAELPIVVDWFDPFHLQALHRGGDDRIRRLDLVEGARQTLLDQARRGDFFLCSNDYQRDHWLGWLGATGRLNPLIHELDPTFSNLIAVAPFGVANEPIRRTQPIRAAYSNIGNDDPIVLWAGGLHDWLDPLTVIRAMPAALEHNPDIRLVFLAGPHPNTSIDDMGIRGEAITLARELRLFAKSVIFVNQWIDYAERLNWLADADIGIVTHRAHLESRYAHRTRIVDHLAAGLPTIASAGETASTSMAEAGAALLVPPEDADSLGSTIAALVADDAGRQAMGRAANSLAAANRWEVTLEPLLGWLRSPVIAADRQPGANTGAAGGIGARSTVDRLAGRARMHLDDGGPSQLLRRSLEAGRRRLRR